MNRVFVSHITEEASLARVLKAVIEETFPGQVEVFVSSDQDCLPAGSKWFETIDSTLNESKAMAVLCSAVSIGRPWINFETGCAWIRQIPVIPICHSGVSKDTLPVPLSKFQALDLANPEFTTDFLRALAHHLSIARLPRVDHAAFTRELLAVIPACFQEVEGRSRQSTDLDEIEVQILKTLQAAEGRHLMARHIADHLQVHLTKIEYYLQELVKKRMVHDSLAIGRPTTYALIHEGRRYLVEHKLI